MGGERLVVGWKGGERRGWVDGEGIGGCDVEVCMVAYRLDGKGVFRRLLRAMGSNEAMCSDEGPGVCIEDDGSTSSESSVMPLKVDALRLEWRRWIDGRVFFFKGNCMKTKGTRWLVIVGVVDVEWVN